MICSNCGAQFPDTDQVCWQCGRPVNQGGNVPYNNMPYNNANQMNQQPMYNQPNQQPMYNQPNQQQMYNQPNQQPMYNQMNPQPMYNQNYQAPKQGGGSKTLIIVLSLVAVIGIILGLITGSLINLFSTWIVFSHMVFTYNYKKYNSLNSKYIN